MSIEKENFDTLAKIIKDNSGIVLAAGKEYLIEGRLLPVARKYNLSNINDLVVYMQENNDESLLVEVIEAMTTNESFFFRDIKPFDVLRDELIPRLLEKCPGKTKFRIWCAACSTGQEPYSVAITVKEHPKCQGINFEILATDLDYNVLEKSEEGVYTQFEVQRGMPINLLLKYFSQENGQWRVKEDLKSIIDFQQYNLLGDPSKFGNFDIIFCRNVLIYFDTETKENVLRSLCSRMEDHSTLYLGSAESVLGMDVPLTLYDKNISGIFMPKK